MIYWWWDIDMKVIYEKHNGNIITIIPEDMNYKLMFTDCDEGFVNNLSEIIFDKLPKDYVQTYKYYIKGNTMLEYTDSELKEKEIYGKILTEEERLLLQLKPSTEEVQKAETAIEILSLLQEVL